MGHQILINSGKALQPSPISSQVLITSHDDVNKIELSGLMNKFELGECTITDAIRTCLTLKGESRTVFTFPGVILH